MQWACVKSRPQQLLAQVDVDASPVIPVGRLVRIGRGSTAPSMAGWSLRSLLAHLVTTQHMTPLIANTSKTIGLSQICSKRAHERWSCPSAHTHSFETSSSVMAPFFTNQSCDPFLPKSSTCRLGNYINYAIDVAERPDISKGIAFATRYNIRLVIRNTGHE